MEFSLVLVVKESFEKLHKLAELKAQLPNSKYILKNLWESLSIQTFQWTKKKWWQKLGANLEFQKK